MGSARPNLPSPGRRLRRGGRGAHRAVAGRPGRSPAGRPARAARRAGHVHRRPGRAATDRRDRGDGVPALEPGHAAPGSATARPAWTTSSTPSPRCCARSPSSSTRRCRRRGGPGPGQDDSAGPGGVVVGRGTRGRAQPVPRRARRPRRDARAGHRPRASPRSGKRRAPSGPGRRAGRRPAARPARRDDPAARIAAGVVAAIVGGADLVRRPSPEPALAEVAGRPGPGRRAARPAPGVDPGRE